MHRPTPPRAAAIASPAPVLTSLLWLVRVALFLAWAFMAVLVVAAFAEAWTSDNVGRLLGPGFLMAWVACLGWIGLRSR